MVMRRRRLTGREGPGGVQSYLPPGAMAAGIDRKRGGPSAGSRQPLNPNRFMGPGYTGWRDPMAHQRHWANQGWTLQGGRFVPSSRGGPQGGAPGPVRNIGRPGASQMGPWGQPGNTWGSQPNYGPGGPPRGGPRPTPGTGPPTTLGGGGGGGNFGLPLDPYLEQQRRLLSDALSGNLAALGPAREQLLANSRLGETRLGTNEDIDERRLLDEMAARGIVGSGIQARDTGRLATDYLRSRQDLANTTAGGLNDLALAEAGYRGDYNRGLIEALMASAANAAMDPYAPVPTQGAPRPPRRRPRRPGPRRRRPNAQPPRRRRR